MRHNKKLVNVLQGFWNCCVISQKPSASFLGKRLQAPLWHTQSCKLGKQEKVRPSTSLKELPVTSFVYLEVLDYFRLFELFFFKTLPCPLCSCDYKKSSKLASDHKKLILLHLGWSKSVN